jgi:hypothetical protein
MRAYGICPAFSSRSVFIKKTLIHLNSIILSVFLYQSYLLAGRFGSFSALCLNASCVRARLHVYWRACVRVCVCVSDARFLRAVMGWTRWAGLRESYISI